MIPSWFANFLGVSDATTAFNKSDIDYNLVDDIFRANNVLSQSQAQTKETFGFKWKKESTFDSDASCNRMKQWLENKYGDISSVLNKCSDMPKVLDAGCGAGLSFLALWEEFLHKMHYVGVDISEAIDVAKKRFEQRGFNEAAFIQTCLTDLPFEKSSFDIVFSEGVLHHTDNTHNAFKYLSEFVKPNGYFMFYVYKKKAPIREFTDDYIREQLSQLDKEAAWESLKPLSKLGIALGELDTKINVPEAVEFLGIPAGEIDVQRLFYWYVFKAFYNPELTFDEMHHINFDWYAPTNAHRHTPEEVREWCKKANFEIEHEKIEDAGITVIARKL